MILVMIMMVIWMMLIVLINRQSTMINWRLLHWKLYAQTTDAEQDLFSNVKLSAHSTFVKYCPAQNIRPTLIIALKSIPCLQMVLKTISASIRSASKLSPAPYINLIPLYHFWTWKNNIFFWQFLEQSHHQSHLVVIWWPFQCFIPASFSIEWELHEQAPWNESYLTNGGTAVSAKP